MIPRTKESDAQSIRGNACVIADKIKDFKENYGIDMTEEIVQYLEERSEEQ